jgi:hypothetical protein
MAKSSVNFLPSYYRTDKNTKFLSSTLDQFISQAELERLNGYVGSTLSPNYNPVTDTYISDALVSRNRYQLTPALVIKNLDGSVDHAYGYDDLVNQLAHHGADTGNLDKLFRPDILSFNPPINWDKLINFREYYWLPTGPDPILVTGTQRELVSTYTVKVNADGNFFIFTPDGLTESPLLTLYRGTTYVFNVEGDTKLFFKNTPGYGTNDLYSTDIIGNGIANGQIIISITDTSPNNLYYSSDSELIGSGQIVIRSIEQNSAINVEAEIIGKSSYISGNGIEFVNGLKVVFGGDVTPSLYRNKTFIVEGVGTAIILVDYDTLSTPESFSTLYDDNFDADNFDKFPFDNFQSLPIDPSYITINRASRDLNPWTRYNRWFHSSVLAAVAKSKGENLELPVTQQARRPIVEFNANLQLFNFGNTSIPNVTLIDNLTTDAFSNVEGSTGYWVDEVRLDQGQRVIFNADLDSAVRNKVYEVNFVTINGKRQISLQDTGDIVKIDSCVTVESGVRNTGTVWWYITVNGVTQWIKGQQKTEINQAPLFDVVDDAGYSYGGSYYTSDFSGTKIFNYAVGTGVADPVLGFPLQYTNTGLESSYLFSNYFGTDTFQRIYPDIASTQLVSQGYLKSNNDLNTAEYLNVWTPGAEYKIPVVQYQVLTTSTNQIQITCFDNPAYIKDLTLTVYLNDVKNSDYTLIKQKEKLFVQFNTEILADQNNQQKVRFEFFTSTSPNQTGVYLTPINLTNNPLNGPVSSLTLAELYDHVNTMIIRDPNFNGVFPGSSNLGNLPSIAKYGTRIISNYNTLAMAQYFISNQDNNLIDATRVVGDDYNQFKLNLIKTITDLGDTGTPAEVLDSALAVLNENKNNSFPYFLSDMIPAGSNKKTRNYTVTDSRNLDYSITNVFDSTALSNQGILVFLNGTQQVLDQDYIFNKYDPTVTFKTNLTPGDKIIIEEYLNTDGSYIPPTPTKLGLYPKFVPSVYQDTSYAESSQTVIQGHDGSIILAFNDYRDDVLLEYEKRVYNNIKTTYNSNLFDINSVLPGLFRQENFSYSATYNLVVDLFKRWTLVYGIDYEDNLTYAVDNHRTWNFKSATDFLFGRTMPGSFRAIYKYYFDTDRPDTHPWEMLGITVKPDWWDSHYGPAPYTSGNVVLWNDIEQGKIAQGTTAGINALYARPGLSQIIPVDEHGELVDPRFWASIGLNDSISDTDQDWAFGDWGPAENAYRRSSYWPYVVQIISALIKPADYAAKLYDVSRMSLNNAGQYTYGTSNSVITPANLKINGDVVDGITVRTSGYSVLVTEIGNQRYSGFTDNFKRQLQNGNFNLFSKLGGFVSKDKLNIVIDSVQVGTTNPVPYLPNEDYNVHFNVSNPVKTISISGIVVIKRNGKFIVRGYDTKNLYFTSYKPIHQLTDPTMSIGGQAESYITWTSGKTYIAGNIIVYSGAYYRVLVGHTAGTVFNASYFAPLANLPIVGGVTVQTALNYETAETQIGYGTKFETIQDVTDFLYGYGKWLEGQGFIFDDYNADFQQTIDWAFTVKEFVYWTTQNWADNSVITLSPFANKLSFSYANGVVDNIFNNFNEYSLLKADGLVLPAANFSLTRHPGSITITTKNTYNGIFFATLNLVQKEHALIFNNTTIFNDVVYAIETGYRQQRVKLEGFRTAGWSGDFISPGFIYDNANIQVWAPYADYQPGDLVQYVGKYYSANNKISGTQKFDFTLWTQLSEKPVNQLLPNFDYKINQFQDFYSLDIDNFDAGVQSLAQHLTGYSPRTYLENIFDNPISQYKFYQGYIKEKGTLNAITKLEKASVASLQGKLELFEEWAFRVGSFGSYSNFNEIEFPLRETEFVENNQLVQFVDSIPAVSNNLISYIIPQDASILPPQYISTMTFVTTSGTFANNNLILPYAGYTRLDDVDATFIDIPALTKSTMTLSDGKKVWVAFDNLRESAVYRYTRQPSYITNITQSGTDINVTTNKQHGLKVGDVIAIDRYDPGVNGIFTVTNISDLLNFMVNSPLAQLPMSPTQGVLGKFESARFATPDDVANLEYLADIHDGELFWIDDVENNGRWGVVQKNNNYKNYEITAPRTDLTYQQFAFSVAKSANSTTMVVSAPANYNITDGYGRIYVYDYQDAQFNEITNYSLNSDKQYHPITNASGLDRVVFDETDDLIFASGPKISNLRSTTGSFIISSVDGILPSHFTKQGAVKISGFYKTMYASEIPYAVVVDPSPADNIRFGSSVFVEKTANIKKVLIGSPGQNTAGAVYRYQVNIQDTVNTSTYTLNTGTVNTGSGIGALFNVENYKGHYSVDLYSGSPGILYDAGNIIKIKGTQVGGVLLQNDITITVTTVNTSGAITKFAYTGTGALRTFSITADSQVSLPYPEFIQQNPANLSDFGYNISGSKDASTIVVSSPGVMVSKGGVHIYNLVNNVYTLSQSIPNYRNIEQENPELVHSLFAGDRLGEEVVMSEDGKYLFISSTRSKGSKIGPGKVWIYQYTGSRYEFLQLLENPSKELDLTFGHSIAINDKNNVLSVTSQGTNIFKNITFDGGDTLFDGGSCLFGSLIKGAGSAYVYNRYNTKFLLGEELFDNSVDQDSHYGTSVIVEDDTVYVSSPGTILSNGNVDGSVYVWNKINPDIYSWSVYRNQPDLIDTNLIKKSFTLDVTSNQITDYLDVIDPLKGYIPGIADQELKYKTAFDPAVYNNGSSTSGVVVDQNSYWGSEHVGELWWDLSNVKYVWYEQGEISYRQSTWGQLFPGVEINIYEWVASSYTPAQWSLLADTTAGLAAGISGQPLFTDNSVYSSSRSFDKNTEQFTNLYYFWVKNKTVVPNFKNRRLSASDVSRLLTNPKSYGLEYLSILSANAAALTNFNKKLLGNRIYLNIGYNKSPTDIIKHTAWSLVQENNQDSVIPEYLESKLFDSLIGKDRIGNLIPDPYLPSRSKYGIEIRPKQSMFSDRFEALRTLTEYTNSVLIALRTRGFVSFDNLDAVDTVPNILLGQHDKIVESVEARDIIITTRLRRAQLTCEITNGKITAVNVVDPGYGYITAPTVIVTDVINSNIEIKTLIDENGSISAVEIVNPGSNLLKSPTLLVRAFTVIVQVDPDYPTKWSKYEWSGASWNRIYIQKFNTSAYWKYVDWADASFNYSKILTATVNELAELGTLSLAEGNYVKVNNPGDGFYIILRATAGAVGTFNNKFDIVYVEQGTIQILDTVWNFSSNQLGYDNNNTFDQTSFDQTPDIELTYILKAIKHDLFSGVNRLYWNKFFFKAVRYALTEQKLLDWAFKTTFINVRNLAGVLDQRTTYRYQDTTWYENYLEEIKPYHTKIRNYQVNYQIGPNNSTPYENSNNFNTDFDLPAVYDIARSNFITASSSTSLLAEYPWKAWTDNYGLSVDSITIINPGKGYVITPLVHVIPAFGDNVITTATAVAYIAYGKIREIVITNPGYGYTQQPTIVITGGGDTQLTTATAYAVMSNSLVRNNNISMKFDRITNGTTSTIGNAQQFTDVYTANGSKFKFDLTWYANAITREATVTFNGILVMPTEYTINNYTSSYTPAGSVNSYSKKYSQLAFTSIPPRGTEIKIVYNKNIEIYSAAERIRDYYNPVAGMPGKQFGQLMDGVDYPGVQIETLPFNYSIGWNGGQNDFVIGFEESSYANDIDFYTSIAVDQSAIAGTDTIILSNITGVLAGQYANIVSTSTTVNLFTATNVQVLSVNSSTNSVTFNSTLSNTVPVAGTNIEFWSFNDISSDVDTLYTGGDLTYTTARGLRPSDIILDGDGFLTPYTSHAPEEVVPGQVQESLSISVFTREPQGSPLIVTQSQYIASTGTDYFVNLTLRPANTSSVLVSVGGEYLTYGVDYSIDVLNKQVTINTKTQTGLAGITVVGVGGTEILGSKVVTAIGPGSVNIDTLFDYDIVNSVYVTVNGETVPQTSATTLGYTLKPISKKNSATRLTVHELSTGTNIIQAWFFQGEYKGFSEVKEQIITVSTTATIYNLIQPPGVVGPYHAQAIVELDGLRLTPPETTYYEVANNQTVFDIRPGETHPPGAFDLSQLEVYLNGQQLSPLYDFFLDRPKNQIRFNSGFIANGDVLAISVLLNFQYTIHNNQLILKVAPALGSTLKILTFTNHNASNIRTEIFKAVSNNQYKLSRKVIDDSYAWVTISGRPLINKFDYRILADGVTVEISSTYEYNLTDTVLITSFSDVVADTVIGYRMFKDIFGSTYFKRLSEGNTTYLTQPLSITDSEIYVEDTSNLPIPAVSQNAPGVVFIQGERIEYFVKTSNMLGQLRRTTLGTGARNVYPEGTAVIDQGRTQNIPVSDQVLIQSTTATSSTYIINPITTTSTGDGIILDLNVDAINQIEVYYSGRLLSKSTATIHNFDLAYDSGEYSSDSIKVADYTVDLASQTITLLCPFTTTTNTITVIQRKGTNWNNSGASLLNSNTAQAQFLQQRQSGLPDKYQYGKF